MFKKVYSYYSIDPQKSPIPCKNLNRKHRLFIFQIIIVYVQSLRYKKKLITFKPVIEKMYRYKLNFIIYTTISFERFTSPLNPKWFASLCFVTKNFLSDVHKKCEPFGRAFGSHPRGQGFKSLQVHHTPCPKHEKQQPSVPEGCCFLYCKESIPALQCLVINSKKTNTNKRPFPSCLSDANLLPCVLCANEYNKTCCLGASMDAIARKQARWK